MKKLLLAGCLFLAGCETTSNVEDPSATHFIKFYGTDGDQTGRDLEVLPDGSMVLFGTTRPTEPTAGTQWYIVKVDAKGTIIWEKEYGRALDDEARDIELLASGNLVLLGNTYQSANNRDVLVMIISASSGDLLDSATRPTLDFTLPGAPPSSGDEDASTITELSDGTFLIAGTTTYTGIIKNTPPVPPPPGLVDSRDALKMRLTADLSVYTPWAQTYGLIADDKSIKIVAAPAGSSVDGGAYYSFGHTNSVTTAPINFNYSLYRLSADGDPLGPTITNAAGDEVSSSVAVQGSTCLIAGLDAGTPSTFYIVEAALPATSVGFPLRFEKVISINLGSNLSGHTACWKAKVNGGYYILGEENGFNGNQNWLLIKITDSGLPEWTQPIVYGGEGMDSAGAVRELPDGRVVIIGTMRTGRPDAGEYKLTLVKVNPEGKFEK